MGKALAVFLIGGALLVVLALSNLAWGTSPSLSPSGSMALSLAPDAAPEEAEAPDAGPAPVVVVPVPIPVQAVEQDPFGSAGNMISAIRQGNWRLAASLMLALIMFALARVRNHVKWFSGDRGGAVLVMFLSLAGALSTSLAAGMPVDWKMFAAAIGIAWTAVGGYTWIKKLIWPAPKKPAPGDVSNVPIPMPGEDASGGAGI